MIFLVGVLLPWLVLFGYLYLCYRYKEIIAPKKHKKIWVALSITYPFFVIATMTMAKASFHQAYFPYYLITILLLLLFLITIHLYFFREIIWPEFIKMMWRIIIQLTIVMNIFFILTNCILRIF